MPKCPDVNECSRKVTKFIYEKACAGDSKLVYCPKVQEHSGVERKTPDEWQLSLSPSTALRRVP